MSLLLKILLPVLLIGGLVWLYTTKYPSLIAQPQTTTTQEPAKPTTDPSTITTDEQLTADLKAADTELGAASAATAVAQEFTDSPVSQTE